eukprot:864611-Pelagomonas_calceolata.AAC.3
MHGRETLPCMNEVNEDESMQALGIGHGSVQVAVSGAAGRATSLAALDKGATYGVKLLNSKFAVHMHALLTRMTHTFVDNLTCPCCWPSYKLLQVNLQVGFKAIPPRGHMLLVASVAEQDLDQLHPQEGLAWEHKGQAIR